MSIESAINAAIYGSALAEAATYIDQSGAETAIKVVPFFDSDELPDGADIGRQANTEVFRVRKSDVAEPLRGDSVSYDGASYVVDGYASASKTEHVLFVLACDSNG